MQPTPLQSQPAISIPQPVLIFVGVLVALHLYMIWALDADALSEFMVSYAFFPAVFRAADFEPSLFDYARFFTYGFLHLATMHLVMNALWLVVFGSPIARFGGGLRFFILMLAGFLGGALLYVVMQSDMRSFLIGASAGVSALMGAVVRLGFYLPESRSAPYVRPWSAVRADTQSISFVAIWLLIELGFNAFAGGVGGGAIAWQAHIGGFVAGLLIAAPLMRAKLF